MKRDLTVQPACRATLRSRNPNSQGHRAGSGGAAVVVRLDMQPGTRGADVDRTGGAAVAFARLGDDESAAPPAAPGHAGVSVWSSRLATWSTVHVEPRHRSFDPRGRCGRSRRLNTRTSTADS